MEPLSFDLGNGGVEQHDVVAVRARGSPPDRDPRPVCRDRPLPAEFSPVHRALAGAVAAAGSFVSGPVDAHVIEIESHDPVIGSDRFGRNQLEHPSSDPLVATGPQRRVRHLPSQQRLRGLPRAARRQTHQDPLKAQPVRYPGPIPPAKVTNRPHPQQRLDRRPDHIHHLRLQSAHDETGLHGLSCSAQPDQYTGEPANPWMANPRGL